MDSGLLSLKWNNHSSTFFDVLETIRKKGLYSDVTIACDGKYFEVHKLVLSTCSDYFQEMFEKTQCKHPIVVLKDINYKDLEFLLNYMYVGEVNVLQNELASLIKAAECLRVKGLAVPDEPPSRKSSKRSNTNDKEESSSKRSKKSSNYNPEVSQSSSRNVNVDSDTAAQPTNFSSSEDRNFTSNSHSSDFTGFDTTNIKEEILDDPTEIYKEDSLGDVKYEKFDDVPPDEMKDLHSSARNDTENSSYSSQLPLSKDQNDSLSHIMPSTSGFGDPSSWPDDIETIDDDDDEVGPDDLGNYDPSAFGLDPSQAKAQMERDSWGFAVKRCEDPEILSLQYMEMCERGWRCSFPECSYSGPRSYLIRHVRKHTGQKPFQCIACDFKSSRENHVIQHYKTLHVFNDKYFHST